MNYAKNIAKTLLGATALTVFSTGVAFADGTSAGTSVANTFTLDYEVGGQTQPTIETCDGAAACGGTDSSTRFTVDRKIDLTVAITTTPEEVFPGETDALLVFTVTNTGNDTQAYRINLTDDTSDDFDPTAATYYVFPALANGTCDTATNLVPANAYNSGDLTADVLPDATICLVAESDIPLTTNNNADGIDGDVSNLTLFAETWSPVSYLIDTAPGTSVEETADQNGSGTNSILGVAENVLIDQAGPDGNDNASDGDHSAIGTYEMVSADLEALKSVAVITTDGTGCGTTPTTPTADDNTQYPIPGACVEYVITITNKGSTDATAINISDVLPSDVTYASSNLSGFSAGSVDDTAAPTISLVNGTLDEPTGGATQNDGYLIIRATVN